MWQNNEIKEGDSGRVVSNKLDAEFARIQTVETEYYNKFINLRYTDTTTVMDKEKDNLIVSPHTMWYALNPLIYDMRDIKKITDHMTETIFDGVFWIRTDVPIEYVGTPYTFENMRDGQYVRKADLSGYAMSLKNSFISTDGTNAMDQSYTPISEKSVATKEYVDAKASNIKSMTVSQYIEYPPAEYGDVEFNASIGTKNFMVFINGVLQRRDKYSYDAEKIVFTSGLDAGDEVTIFIAGGE